MAESFKILAQGLVPNAATVMYTVPAGKQSIIKGLRVTNPTGNGDVQFSLWHNGSTDSLNLFPAVTILEGGFMIDDTSYTMDDGDTLEAMGSVDDALTFTAHGLEIG